MLSVPEAVVAETFDHFRACGQGRAECVVYWTGPAATPHQIDDVVHPHHRAGAVHYDVDGPWINEFWVALGRDNRAVRAQVHTHPGETFHSSRDDELALVQLADFVSLVIPRFGQGAVGLAGAYLTKRDASGNWRPASLEAEIEVV